MLLSIGLVLKYGFCTNSKKSVISPFSCVEEEFPKTFIGFQIIKIHFYHSIIIIQSFYQIEKIKAIKSS